MTGLEEFFSQKHKRLLNIATWAKYLAWVVFIVNILYALGMYYQLQSQLSSIAGTNIQFLQLLRNDFSYALSFGIEIVSVVFKGVVYFLLLKAISLGLNMIVETDINYRDNNEKGDNHE